MALQGSFNTNSYDGRYLKFSWELETQNIYTGESTISWRLVGAGVSTNKNYYPITNIKITIDGAAIYTSDDQIDLWEGTVVQSGSYIIAHNSDGSKDFSAEVESVIYTANESYTGNGTWTLPSITISSGTPGQNSTFSFSPHTNTFEIGDEITVNITRSNSNYVHDVEFYLSGYGRGTDSAFYKKYTSVATSQSFTVPDIWCNYMVSNESCTAYCRVITKNSSGTTIGLPATKQFTVKVPTSIVPTIGSLVLNPIDVQIDGISYNYLIKDKNKLEIKASGCEAGTGSKIKSYKFSGPSVSQIIETLDSSTETSVSSVRAFGDLTYTLVVTDARGRTASTSVDIYCYNYQNPYFKNFATTRSGTQLTYTFTVCFSDLKSGDTTEILNSATVNVYVDTNTLVKTITDVTSNTSVTGSFTLTSDTTHTVYATVTDALNSSARSDDKTIFSDAKIVNIASDGLGLALGKMSEKNGFECDWDAQFNGDVNIGGNFKVSGNLVLGPNSTINFGKIGLDGDFVTSDELPTKVSDLTNDVGYIPETEFTTIANQWIATQTIYADYVYADNILTKTDGSTINVRSSLTLSGEHSNMVLSSTGLNISVTDSFTGSTADPGEAAESSSATSSAPTISLTTNGLTITSGVNAIKGTFNICTDNPKDWIRLGAKTAAKSETDPETGEVVKSTLSNVILRPERQGTYKTDYVVVCSPNSNQMYKSNWTIKELLNQAISSADADVAWKAFKSSIIPANTNKISLGSSSKQWNALYVKTLYINGEEFTGGSGGVAVFG